MSEQGQLKGDIISWNGITGNKSFEDILDDVLDNTLKPNDLKIPSIDTATVNFISNFFLVILLHYI